MPSLMRCPTVPLQPVAGRCVVPEPIARMAYDEYARHYGTDQSFEHLHERGGFGTIELMHLLCERIVFLEARTKGAAHAAAKDLARKWPETS